MTVERAIRGLLEAVEDLRLALEDPGPSRLRRQAALTQSKAALPDLHAAIRAVLDAAGAMMGAEADASTSETIDGNEAIASEPQDAAPLQESSQVQEQPVTEKPTRSAQPKIPRPRRMPRGRPPGRFGS